MRVILTGAGVVGLTAAMLLAEDGHDVTVLDRDPQPPPDPEAAWSDWERHGVNQFRLLHFFQPRFCRIMEAELPAVMKAMESAGGYRMNPVAGMPDEMRGSWRDSDAAFECVTGRRPVMEAAIAGAAAATAGVTIRRGVAVKGLLTDGARHVVGVCTDSGEELRGDVVVDAGGRRSSLPAMLADVGIAPPVEEVDDFGFVYYGRHFRGDMPFIMGPLLQEYDSVGCLTLPADNDTWGVGVIASARDTAMRGCTNAERWTNVVRSLPLAAHWLDGEPLEEQPLVMAKIPDRRRTFVVDGEPVATGVLAVGDAWACTNPSLGRGMAIGAIHAVALRDLLHDAPADARQLAVGWAAATDATAGPYVDATMSFDRHRLAEIDALLEGRPPPVDDEWELTKALNHAAGQDPDVLRGLLRIANVLANPGDVFADPDLFTKVIELGADWRDAPSLAPPRDQLVALASA